MPVTARQLGEPGVVDLRQRNGSEAALVELVQGHDLDGSRDDLPVELLVDPRPRKLAGDDEDLEPSLVDRAADLRERAEVRALERRRVQLPVVRSDRRRDVEVAGVGALQLLAQPQRLGRRADDADLHSRVAAEDAVAEPDDDQRLDRGDDQRPDDHGLAKQHQADDRAGRADHREAAGRPAVPARGSSQRHLAARMLR